MRKVKYMGRASVVSADNERKAGSGGETQALEGLGELLAETQTRFRVSGIYKNVW